MNYDYLTSAIKISVPNYTDSKSEPGTIFFNIHLQAKDNKWYVQKRFSEFDQLVNGLKNTYHNLPPLPKKSYLFKMTDKDLQARKQGLQQFLRKVIVRNDLMNSELLKQFLQLDKNASQMMVQPPKLQWQYSIEGVSKGIRDYIYIEDSNIFLIATTDVNPVSKLQAKFQNTKLPWQNQNGKFMQVGSIEAWSCDLTSSKFVKIWSKGYPQEAICLSYDKASKKILVGLDDGVVDFIHMTENGYEDIVCDKIHKDRINGLAYDSLTNVVFSISQDKIFRISHGTSFGLILGLPHKEQLLSMVKDTINKRIFVGTKIGQVLIYDISNAQKPKLLNTLRNNRGGAVKTMYFDNARNYLFTGSFDDGQINVFDLDKPGKQKLAKLNATLNGKQKIRAITWSSKRAQIMTGAADGTITYWNAVQGKPIYLAQSFDTQITKLDYIPQRNWLISASKARCIKIWALPKEWRDPRLIAEQEKQARKDLNTLGVSKITSNYEKKAEDSDDDDLAGWHLD